MDAEGQRLLDARTNPPAPGPGPGHITSYSPKIGEGLGPLGRYLGVPRGDDFPLGARYFQLIVLMTAREIDQQYEWSAHECMALMGDYFIVGTMMNAADQHLPPTRQPLLPALKR